MPRYVILHHTGHPDKKDHYDLMLERDGVLRTWVLEGPEPTGKAVQSFDHRLVYASYEGPVRNARGHVRRVAHGTYEAIEWGEGRIQIKLESHLVSLVARGGPGEGSVWVAESRPA